MMNNLLGFDKFKMVSKINEAGNNAIGHDDPFINVKGNFAGADQTLVGSGIIKIFNFFKRKGQQALLFTYYKPKLHAEYMAGLLRYAIRAKLNVPKKTTTTDTQYEISQIKDINNQVVEQQIKIKVKLSNLTKENEIQIGTNVIGDNIQDGYYMFYEFELIYKIVSGKVADDGDVPDSVETNNNAPIDDTITNTNTDTVDQQTNTNSNEDTFIHDFCVDTTKQLQANPELAKSPTILKKLSESIKMAKNNIKDINNLLSNKNIINNIQKRAELESDKAQFEKDLKELEKLKTLIESLNKTPNQQSTTTNVNQAVNASYDFEDDDILNEGIIGKVVGKVTGKTAYTNPSSRHGDELNTMGFGMVNVDLYNAEFGKHFEIQQNKQAATNVVLESKSSIVRIQLAAERMYMSNDGKVDRKLQNNWLQMTENIKSKFGKFLFVDQLDPKNLRSKIGTSEENELAKKNNGLNGMTNIVDQMNTRNKYNKAEKIGKLIDNLRSMKSGDLGIFELSTGEDKSGYIFTYDTMSINGKLHPTYRLIGAIDVIKFVEKCEKNETDLETLVSRNKTLGVFNPQHKSYTLNNVIYNHITTFMISTATNTNISINNSSNVYIVYVYSNQLINTLSEINTSNCLLYAVTQDGKVSSFVNPNQSEKDLNKNKIKISVGMNVFQIKTSEKGKLGLTEKDQTLNLGRVEVKTIIK